MKMFRRFSPGWVMAIPSILSILVCIVVSLPIEIRAALGVAFAGGFIWFVVRQTNRRDDPLHAKLPPDAP